MRRKALSSDWRRASSLAAYFANGLPSLLLPLGAYQPHNAARARELGVSATLDATTATAEEIGARARAILEDETMRARCAAIADELAALPDARVAVAALEEAARR